MSRDELLARDVEASLSIAFLDGRVNYPALAGLLEGVLQTLSRGDAHPDEFDYARMLLERLAERRAEVDHG